jgi:adenylate cyclase
MSLRGPIAAPDDIVIVSMDEDSYHELDISPTAPWPRAIHARLLERLRELGARRVVFDVLFIGASDDGAIDEELASAVGEVPVVLGAELETRDAAGYAVTSLATPDGRIALGAEQIALVNLPEESGTVRSFLIPDGEAAVGFSSLAVASMGKTAPGPVPDARALINFYGPAGRGIRTLSYYQVLEREVPLPEKFIRDKVVFVGLMLRTETGPAQKDSFMTPFGRMFGVEIHATAAGNVAHGTWIQRASHEIESSLLSAATFVVGLGTLTLAPLSGAVFLLLFAAVWAVGSVLALSAGFFVPGAILFFVIAPLLYTASTIVQYLRSRRERRELARAFGYYLAPAMVAELARDPEGVKLGGDLVEATAVFTDLADFTTLSESLSPAALVSMLNDYFTVATRVVHEEGGTLIKFIGDAMFVLWGAPLKMSDHAARAVRAAEKMQRAIVAFNARGVYPPLTMRIGINTGQMVVGNVGAETRFDYTAMGDAVNLASRVEGLNKYFDTTILATSTALQAAGRNDGLEVGLVRVKGKEQAVELYALFIDEISSQSRAAWRRALELFRHRRWSEAAAAFAELERTESALTTAADFYGEQIKLLSARALPPGWRGEVVFEAK